MALTARSTVFTISGIAAETAEDTVASSLLMIFSILSVGYRSISTEFGFRRSVLIANILLGKVNLRFVVIEREFVVFQEIESGDAGYFRPEHSGDVVQINGERLSQGFRLANRFQRQLGKHQRGPLRPAHAGDSHVHQRAGSLFSN